MKSLRIFNVESAECEKKIMSSSSSSGALLQDLAPPEDTTLVELRPLPHSPSQVPVATLPSRTKITTKSSSIAVLQSPFLPSSPISYRLGAPFYVQAGMRALCLVLDTPSDSSSVYEPGVVENLLSGDDEDGKENEGDVHFAFYFDSGDVQAADSTMLREEKAAKPLAKKKPARTKPASTSSTTLQAAPPRGSTELASGSEMHTIYPLTAPIPQPMSLVLTGQDITRAYTDLQTRHALVTSISFSSTTIKVGKFEAAYAAKLTSLSFSNRITEIGFASFCLSGLVSLSLTTTSLTHIGERAFAVCRSLKSISFPPCLKHVKGHAFANCTSLSTLDIPPAMNCKWEKGVFYNCVSLHDSIRTDANFDLGRNTALVLAKYGEKTTWEVA